MINLPGSYNFGGNFLHSTTLHFSLRAIVSNSSSIFSLDNICFINLELLGICSNASAIRMTLVNFIKMFKKSWNLRSILLLCCLCRQGSFGIYFAGSGRGAGFYTSTQPYSFYFSMSWLPSCSIIFGSRSLCGSGNSYPLLNSIVLHSFPSSVLGTYVSLGSLLGGQVNALANCPSLILQVSNGSFLTLHLLLLHLHELQEHHFHGQFLLNHMLLSVLSIGLESQWCLVLSPRLLPTNLVSCPSKVRMIPPNQGCRCLNRNFSIPIIISYIICCFCLKGTFLPRMIVSTEITRHDLCNLCTSLSLLLQTLHLLAQY